MTASRKTLTRRELRRAHERASLRVDRANADLARKKAAIEPPDQFAQLRGVVLDENAQATFDEGSLLQAIAQHREQLAQSKVQTWLVAAQNAEPELLQVGLDKIKEMEERITMLIELLGELKASGTLSLPDAPSNIVTPIKKLVVPGDMAPVVPS